MPRWASSTVRAVMGFNLASLWGPVGARLRDDDDLVGTAVVRDGFERLVVVVQGESVRDDAVRPGPTGSKRADRCTERRHLGERALDGDLAPEYVERVEGHGLLGAGDAVHEHGAAAARQGHADLGDVSGTGRLDDVVVAVGTGGLQQRGLVARHVLA